MTSKLITKYTDTFDNYLKQLFESNKLTKEYELKLMKQNGGDNLIYDYDNVKKINIFDDNIKILSENEKQLNLILIDLDSIYEYLDNINEESLRFHQKVSEEGRDNEIFKNYGIKEPDNNNNNYATLISFIYLDNMFFKYYIKIFIVYLNMNNPEKLKEVDGLYNYDIGNINVDYVKQLKFKSIKHENNPNFINKIYELLNEKYYIYRKVKDNCFHPVKKVKY